MTDNWGGGGRLHIAGDAVGGMGCNFSLALLQVGGHILEAHDVIGSAAVLFSNNVTAARTVICSSVRQ
jgi:hypothetical protein